MNLTSGSTTTLTTSRSAATVWRCVAVVALLAVAALVGNRIGTGPRLTAATSDTTPTSTVARHGSGSDQNPGVDDPTNAAAPSTDGSDMTGDASYGGTGDSPTYDAGFDSTGLSDDTPATTDPSSFDDSSASDTAGTAETDSPSSRNSADGVGPSADDGVDATPPVADDGQPADTVPDPDPSSGDPTVTSPTPSTTTANQPPTLPSRPDLVVHIPVGAWTLLVGDHSLSAGWRDADSTADWLCLDFQPEDKQGWGLDGADCTGQGLKAFAPQPGTYVVHVRAKEATAANPAGGAPYSATVNTIRIIAG